MAVSYDAWKKGYESLNDQEKQQYNDRLKSMGDDTYNQYMKQYQQASQPQQTTQQSNFNNQNGTNGGNRVQQQSIQQTANGDTNQNRAGVQKTVTPQEIQSSINDAQSKMQNQNVSPDLDTSKFNQDPGKITVQEGTAQQTGKPDYQANSDARLNEMKGNLDHYFATSPRMFNDRETFNKVFEYNSRESDAQRQLLDSYWKRKEDMDKASQYTSGESIANGLKNSEITTDQLNLIKEYSPEAYKAWQEQQEEQIKLRIVNGIVPPMMEDITSQINDMIKRLGIQAQDALDIEGIYNETMDRTGAWQTLEDANKTVRQIEAVNAKRTAIMSRYAASTGGTVSDALAAARMQKALAPWDTQMEGLQYQYQDYANLYSQKTATATQAANVRALQAQENQRIWNQKTAALGFATDAMSYRTPEQQAQLDIQKQQALNDVNLLYTSQLNDLNRYNQYATTKMQNQLQQELTDLSVEDEAQLKANLNNALSDYYKNYGDIIQRSQSQAVDDIIAYAKKNGISVAEALTQNFIKPLQNKAEYKQKVASDYGMLVSQSIGTINGRSVIMTTNPNGTISYKYIDDPFATGDGTMDNGVTKPYDAVDAKHMTAAPVDYGYKTLGTFLLDKKVGQKAGQCGKFVNDYLAYIGLGTQGGRYYDNDLSTKLNSVNSDFAVEGSIAVFDYGHKSSDGINHGHVGIVTKVYDDGSFDVIDSNYDVNKPETLTKRHINAGSPSCKGFFDPSQPPRATVNYNGLSVIDEEKKQNYLEEARRGQMTDTNVAKIGDIAAEQGWGDERRDALKQGMAGNLTETQIKRMDKEDATFYANSNVKEFTQAMNQFSQLVAALNDSSGVGDMSAIFTFMKTLDPSSVVRESEFESAAATAGVLNPQAIWQKIEKSADGKFLTPQQRKDFQKIAKEFIRIKANNYQTAYDQLARRYQQAGIDVNSRGPTNLAQQLLDSISEGATGPDDIRAKYFGGLYNGNLGYNTTGVGSAVDSNVSFILYGN